MVVFEAPHLAPESPDFFHALLAALQGLIGERGTLVVPTCTATEGLPKEPFDPALSPSEAGAFSEFFRKQPGVVRSHNATHSVAALGPLAESVTAGHRAAGPRRSPWGDAAFGIGSPWDLLLEHHALWLLVGADWSSSFLIDYVRTLDHQRHFSELKRPAFPSFKPALLGRELVRAGIAKRAAACPGLVVAFEARSAVDKALEILDDRPEKLGPSREFRRSLEILRQVRQQGHLQAGAAKSVITPPIPAVRWDGKPLVGTYRDLYARAVFLSDGACSLGLVLCDLLGISRSLADRIRQLVTARLGLPPDRLMIACTHAHSTPDTLGSGYEEGGYLSGLVETVAETVARAARAATGARFGWRRTRGRGISLSRRVRLKDGKVFTVRYGVPSTWRVAASAIAGRGKTDPDLTVMRIEDLEGNLIAGLSNFGCHPSIALASNQVSGDLSGEAMAALERVFDDSPVFLCTNGAGGDVDPTGEIAPWGPRDQVSASRVGRILASQILESLERTQVQEATKLGVSSRVVSLPVRDDWISLLEEEQARMCQEFAGEWQLSDSIREVLSRRRIETEVQVFRLGDLALVGLPGEVLVEMGQKIKAGTGGPGVAIIQLTNDDIGYIPTHRAFSEGGYEVGRHLWGRAKPEAEDILVPTARELIEELFRR